MFSFLESPQLDFLTDGIAHFIIQGAPFAPILLLMIEEAGFPLPIPGDFYVAFIGYQVSLGRLSYLEAFILLVASVLIGSSILFYVSKRWGKIVVAKLGSYLHVDEKKLTQVERASKKYGVLFIIFGRHIPGFRIPITIFAGVTNISYKTFILSTFISVVFWIAFYLSLGESLGSRIVHKIHTSPLYLIFFTIPLIAFLGSTIYFRLTKKN